MVMCTSCYFQGNIKMQPLAYQESQIYAGIYMHKIAVAHEWKEQRSTTRNSVSSMKHLPHELLLPYKEAKFKPTIHYTVSLYTFHCYSTFHNR